jgi:multisubunit Na+/H+ antiporter MnhG subunit
VLEAALVFARAHPLEALCMILAVLLGVVGAQHTYRQHHTLAWWPTVGYALLLAAVIIISALWLASWEIL